MSSGFVDTPAAAMASPVAGALFDSACAAPACTGFAAWVSASATAAACSAEAMGVVNADGAAIYKYLNFNQIDEYVENAKDVTA